MLVRAHGHGACTIVVTMTSLHASEQGRVADVWRDRLALLLESTGEGIFGIDMAGLDRLILIHKVSLIMPLPVSYLFPGAEQLGPSRRRSPRCRPYCG